MAPQRNIFLKDAIEPETLLLRTEALPLLYIATHLYNAFLLMFVFDHFIMMLHVYTFLMHFFSCLYLITLLWCCMSTPLCRRMYYHMFEAGVDCWLKPKPPGGHLTWFWLKVRLSSTAPKKSIVEMGCSEYDEALLACMVLQMQCAIWPTAVNNKE